MVQAKVCQDQRSENLIAFISNTEPLPAEPIAKVEKAGMDRVLLLNYKSGEQEITIPRSAVAIGAEGVKKPPM
jgi:hypothetical protein